MSTIGQRVGHRLRRLLPVAAPSRVGGGTVDRAVALDRLAERRFDLLVIGGGITGAGVALDAVSRGLTVALVEAADFAAGTSSKSSKLVHGGLRYLQQGEVGLVYEALAERQRLLRNAPHLVEPLPFLIPILTKDGLVPKQVARALGGAMWGYDLTGGLRIGKVHKRLDRQQVLERWPALQADRVASGYLYYDARADDARLTVTLVRTAALDYGAVAVNGAQVVGLRKDHDSRLSGAVVDADGRRIEVRAAAVVNATGVWADEVRRLDEGGEPDTIRPAKGVHITLPAELVRTSVAAIVPVPGDRRSVFVVPWGQHCYVGTTDTDYDGPLENPVCTAADVDYLLSALNAALDHRITAEQVIGTWAGLRPLVKGAASARTADLSRRHRVHRSPAGMISVTGGKLTTYRLMAADAVDEVCELLGHQRPSATRRLRLRGAPERGAPVGTGHLDHRYGTESTEVQRLIAADPDLARPLVPGLPYLRAEAVWAVRSEMARNLDDVLARRTRARLRDLDATDAALESVAALVGPELGWDEDRRTGEVTAYRAELAAERAASASAASLS